MPTARYSGTGLADAAHCHGDIANIDGQLRCVAEGPPAQVMLRHPTISRATRHPTISRATLAMGHRQQIPASTEPVVRNCGITNTRYVSALRSPHWETPITSG